MHARASLTLQSSPWTTLDLVAAQVPPALRAWLAEPGLLTARIRELCGDRMRFHMLAPLRESARTGVRLQWNRVEDLPDFVYFEHGVHVSSGVQCAECHGDVSRMPVIRRP